MRRRTTVFGLTIAVMALACLGIAAIPSSLVQTKVMAAGAGDWRNMIRTAAESSQELEAFRMTVQQRSTDLTAAISLSREAMIESSKGGALAATLEADLTRLTRLPAARHQLETAKEDLGLATRNVEKAAAASFAGYMTAAVTSDIWSETARQLSEKKKAAEIQARFGLADMDDVAHMTDKHDEAKSAMDAAVRERDAALTGLIDRFGAAALKAQSPSSVFLDVGVDSVSVDALIRAALEADPNIRKLRSARALEEQKYGTITGLYRSFFGAEAIMPTEEALRVRPVDYKLTLAVYNVFLAELKQRDAMSLSLDPLIPPKEAYLGEQPYMLPSAILSLASAAALERNSESELKEQIQAYYLAAVKAEAAMRQARAGERGAKQAAQTASARVKAGLAAGAEAMSAEEAHVRARIEAASADGAYLRAVLELHYVTGGAFGARLDGAVSAPVGGPPEEAAAGGEAAKMPIVTYEPSLVGELEAEAERLQAQIAVKPEAEAPPEGDSDSSANQGVSLPAALLVTEFNELTEALALAEQAGATSITAAMKEKLTANAEALALALGLPGAATSEAASVTERDALTAEFTALLPYLEAGLFPAVEGEWMNAWAEDAKSAYDEAAWGQLAKSVGSWTGTDSVSAVPLPFDAVAFAPKPVMSSAPPLLIGTPGEVYIPVRAYAEALGYKVVWDAQSYTARLHAQTGSLHIQVGTSQVNRVDGKAVTLTADTYMINGQTFVPISFFADVMGMLVYWSESFEQGVIYGRPVQERSEEVS